MSSTSCVQLLRILEMSRVLSPSTWSRCSTTREVLWGMGDGGGVLGVVLEWWFWCGLRSDGSGYGGGVVTVVVWMVVWGVVVVVVLSVVVVVGE